MNARSSLALVASPLVLTGAFVAACGGSVSVQGRDGAGGAGGSGSGGTSIVSTTISTSDGAPCCTDVVTVTTSTGQGGAPGNAMARPHPNYPPPEGTIASTSTGPMPEVMDVFVAGQAVACSSYSPGSDLACGNQWVVSFVLPPGYQTPGVYPLSDLDGFMNFTGPVGEECWAGGGSFGEGSVEIVAIDAHSIVLTIEDAPTFDFDANGTYTAIVCP